MPEAQPWKAANAARCSCKGTDELCPCQNDPDLFTRKKAPALTAEEAEACIRAFECADGEGFHNFCGISKAQINATARKLHEIAGRPEDFDPRAWLSL